MRIKLMGGVGKSSTLLLVVGVKIMSGVVSGQLEMDGIRKCGN